jgi:hypothetical protein
MRSSRKVKYKKALYKWLLIRRPKVMLLTTLGLGFLLWYLLSIPKAERAFMGDVVAVVLNISIVVLGAPLSVIFVERLCKVTKSFLERKLKELENVY